MKKNAFTLIELIATIGILGMLATITITISVRKINSTKEQARDTMFKSIELAAEKYVTDYEEELSQFKNNDNIYISLQTLVEKEYFTENLVDPTTKKSIPLTNEVYVTREVNGKINTIYNAKQKKQTKLVLNGAYNQYLKQGETYIELGVTATLPNGTDVSNSVIIEGTVNSTRAGTYTIKYKYDDVSVMRNVIVYEGNLPSKDIALASNYIEHLLLNENTLQNGLVQTTATYNGTDYNAGIRYVGGTTATATNIVKNKVYFNCEPNDGTHDYGHKDYNYASSCETWRIIGVFDVEDGKGKTEKRLKIINTESTFKASWDSSANEVNDGRGINQWGPSKVATSGNPAYEGADLYQLLNGYYIGASGSECKYNNTIGQSGFQHTCTTAELASAKMKPLTNIAKKQSSDALWYTYASEREVPQSYLQGNGISAQQTGKSVCVAEGGGNQCNDNVTRTTTWTGLVGLMSASDIVYSNGWLYNGTIWPWTMTPSTATSSACHVWASNSSNIYGNYAQINAGVWPSVYLKADVRINGGNGFDKPYILK